MFARFPRGADTKRAAIKIAQGLRDIEAGRLRTYEGGARSSDIELDRSQWSEIEPGPHDKSRKGLRRANPSA
jgi:hypothetical protein